MDGKINIPNALLQTPICDPKTGIVNEHWIGYLLNQLQYISLIKTAKNGRRVEIDATDCIKVYDASGHLVAQFGGETQPFLLQYDDGSTVITIDNIEGIKIAGSVTGQVVAQINATGEVLFDQAASANNKTAVLILTEEPIPPNRGWIDLVVYDGAGNPMAALELNYQGAAFDCPLDMMDHYIDLEEMTAPAAPGADKARLFVQDNGAGKSQLCVRFHTGAVQILATEP